MGFKWRRCGTRRTVLIERPDIINWTSKYLRSIKKYRAEGRNIVYVDESWVDNLIFSKCWQSDDIVGVMTNTSLSNCLILLNAKWYRRFYTQRIFNIQSWAHQMNGENFTKWMLEKFLPNIPCQNVIVLDSAPYHSIQENKPPSKYVVKQEMVK